MKRGLLVALFSAAVLAGAAGTASAETAGKLGIGFDETLAGAEGISARYWVIPKLSVQLLLSYDQTSADAGDSSQFDLGLRGLYEVLEDESVSVEVGGGLTIQRESLGDESDTGLAIELGLGPTWWATDHFALSLFMGVLIDLNAGAGGDDSQIVLLANPQGSPVSIVGTAGFLWVIN
jgi:hypothetical protein